MGSELQDVLEQLLRDAGATALEHFGRCEARRKPDGTVVTDADQAAESVIVEALSRTFPGDGIQAEEGSEAKARSGHGTWFVDPIDGTSAFLGQLAYWGPTVCRVDVDGALDVGAFFVPRLAESWFAQRGGGAFRDGRRLGPPSDDVAVDDPTLFVPSRFHRAGRAPWSGKVRALGSGAAHMALVAAGSGAGTVVPKWKLWDVGCGALLIRETGRMIWDVSGEPFTPETASQGHPFIAGVPRALRELTAEGWLAGVLGRGSRGEKDVGRDQRDRR
ncbi:MAG: inositol monophosphatase [Myxococcales bacterium]|nr:inositol monophosphatase [Myxococcales bacterium]